MADMTARLIMQLVDQVTGPARAVTSTVRGLQNDLARNNAALAATRGQMVEAAVVGYALARGIAAPLRVSAQFEETMNVVQVTLKATNEQMEHLAETAREIGRTTQFTSREAGSAIEMLAKNGLDYQAIMGGALIATIALAGATGADLSGAADVATDAMLAFGLAAKDLPAIADVISNAIVSSKFTFDDFRLALGQAGAVAANAGLSLEEFYAVIAATSHVFASGSDAGTSFRNFLNFLNPKSSESAAIMQELGLSFFTATGEMKSMVEIAGELRNAFENLTDQQRAEYAHAIFGTDAQRTMQALAALADGKLAEFLEKIRREGTAVEHQEARMKGLSGAAREFASAMEALSHAIGDGLNPHVEAALRALTPLVASLSEFVRAHPNATTAIVGTASALVALRVAALAARFAFLWMNGAMLTGAIVGLRSLSAAALVTSGSLATLGRLALIASRFTVLGAVVGGAAYLIASNWDTVGPIVARAGEMAAGGFSTLMEHATGAVDALKARFAEIKGGIQTFLFGDGLTPEQRQVMEALSGRAMHPALMAGTFSYTPQIGLIERMESSLIAMGANATGRVGAVRDGVVAATAALTASELAADRHARTTSKAFEKVIGQGRELSRHGLPAIVKGTENAAQSVRVLGGTLSTGRVDVQRYTTAIGGVRNAFVAVGRAAQAFGGAIYRTGILPVLDAVRPYLAAAAPFLRLASRINLAALAITTFIRNWDELKLIGSGMQAGFASWMPTLTADVEALKEAWAGAWESIQDAVRRIGALFGAEFSDEEYVGFGEAIGQGLGAIGSAALKAGIYLGWLVDYGAQAVAWLAEFGKGNYEAIWKGIRRVYIWVEKLVGAIRELITELSNLWSKLPEMAAGGFSTLMEHATGAVDALKARFAGIKGGIQTFLFGDGLTPEQELGEVALPDHEPSSAAAWARQVAEEVRRATGQAPATVSPQDISELDRILEVTREIGRLRSENRRRGRLVLDDSERAELRALREDFVELTKTMPETVRAALGEYQRALEVGGDAEAAMQRVIELMRSSLGSLAGDDELNGGALADRLTDSGARGGAGLEQGVRAGAVGAVSAIQAGNSQMVSTIAGLGAQLYAAGANAVGQLAAGIRAGTPAVSAAATETAASVAAKFPQSPVKEGPLRALPYMGAQIVEQLAGGMRAAPAAAAAAAVAASVAAGFSGASASTGPASAGGGPTINVYVTVHGNADPQAIGDAVGTRLADVLARSRATNLQDRPHR